MGQQQLLLVILVTIIVGIATVVAINIFGSAADQANRDAVRQDLMGAAVQAQAIWARPALMDGANRDFADMGAPEVLARLNIPTNDPAFNPGTSTSLTNENGTYSITSIEADQLQITGAPSSGEPNIILDVWRDNGTWQVEIDGEGPETN
jgi:hypothetical protein